MLTRQAGYTEIPELYAYANVQVHSRAATAVPDARAPADTRPEAGS